MKFNRGPNVRCLVIDAEGTKIGHMSYTEAKSLAESKNLDLVEVNTTPEFVVHKIMDKGKWEYEKKKMQKKKVQKRTIQHKPKVVKFRSFIDTHDEATKMNQVMRFLKKGLDVQLVVVMKGRAKSNPQNGHDQITRLITSLGDSIKYSPVKKSSSEKIITFNSTIHPTKEVNNGGSKNQTTH